jgi:hypothetical protein
MLLTPFGTTPIALLKRATLVLTSVVAFSHAAAQSIPVGTLETNQHRVDIAFEGNRPVYSVYDRQGNLLAADLTRDQLFAKLPYLESVLDKGIATDASLYRAEPRFKPDQDL